MIILKKLTILNKDKSIIREVNFQNGLNIIYGERKKPNDTANNLGKTTLNRSLDFCLAGKIEQFYKDPEFKNSNQLIHDFFIESLPTFRLILNNNINDKDTIIEREVTLSKNNKLRDSSFVNKINGKFFKLADFKIELKKLLFNSDSDIPTLRQLIPKFIRKDEELNKILKYLHTSTTIPKYEKIHLFLFGFKGEHSLSNKKEAENEFNIAKKQHDYLKKIFTSNDLEQLIAIDRDELEKLIKSRDSFKLKEKYALDEKSLETLQNSLLSMQQDILDKKLLIKTCVEKLENFNSKKSNIDTDAVEYIYNEAGFYNIQMTKTLSEVQSFHNQMIDNEIDYLNNRINKLKDNLAEISSNRDELAVKYNIKIESLSKKGALAEYTKLNQEIERLSAKLSVNEEKLITLNTLEDKLSKLTDILAKLNAEIDSYMDKFKANIISFNKIFAEYTNRLYGEQYFISFDKDGDYYRFTLKETSGNEGSGKKAAIVAAFDLAYTKFCAEINLPFPIFATGDEIELIDINTLDELFKISNETGGQYIVPVILDKIDSIHEKYKNNIILTLSEDNKFFGI